MSEETKAAVKVKRDRSPAYPFISLKTAIERLQAFDSKFGRHPAPLSKAGLAWDLKPESSQAAQTLSALKYFGLVEYVGSTEDRSATLTENARNYLRAQRASTKESILKDFALKPKAMGIYWSKWGADRPIDEICLDEMILKDGFTESAAGTFLKVYDETIIYAGLRVDNSLKADNAEDHENGSDIPTSVEPTVATPKVGDIVQWESNGVVQFTARRILSMSADGAFAFVEGSATGLPVNEITVIQQTTTQNPTAQKVTLPVPDLTSGGIASQQIGTRQDIFTLDEGPAVLQWPAKMSQTSYEDFKDWVELQLRKIKRSIQ